MGTHPWYLSLLVTAGVSTKIHPVYCERIKFLAKYHRLRSAATPMYNLRWRRRGKALETKEVQGVAHGWRPPNVEPI